MLWEMEDHKGGFTQFVVNELKHVKVLAFYLNNFRTHSLRCLRPFTRVFLLYCSEEAKILGYAYVLARRPVDSKTGTALHSPGAETL